METIDLTTDADGIARLTLRRPEKHNAMNAAMIDELTQAAQDLDGAHDVRAVILGAEGKTFCAGGDLGWMQDQMRADPETRRAEATKLAMMLNALNQLSKPLIGEIRGNCFGGGVGLASVCDIAFCARDVRFGLTETRLGLIPATIGPYVVARMGEARARRVFMSARLFDAAEARDLGLVAEVLDAEHVANVALTEARNYLKNGPEAVSSAKKLVRDLACPVDRGAIDRSIDALVRRWGSDEAAEGIAAFFDKRPPDWTR